MKKLILTLLILLITSIAFSQSGWFNQHSGTSNNITSVDFVNPYTGWCVTLRNDGKGKILKTTNGGDNWFIQYEKNTNSFHSVKTINESIVFVSGLYSNPLSQSGFVKKNK